LWLLAERSLNTVSSCGYPQLTFVRIEECFKASRMNASYISPHNLAHKDDA